MITREHAYQQAGSITVYGETGLTNKKKADRQRTKK